MRLDPQRRMDRPDSVFLPQLRRQSPLPNNADPLQIRSKLVGKTENLRRDGKYGNVICRLRFLLVVNFIKFPLIVFSLFNEIAVAMNVDMEILVKFDNAFEHAGLFFDRAI